MIQKVLLEKINQSRNKITKLGKTIWSNNKTHRKEKLTTTYTYILLRLSNFKLCKVSAWQSR